LNGSLPDVADEMCSPNAQGCESFRLAVRACGCGALSTGPKPWQRVAQRDGFAGDTGTRRPR